ncbi:MAG TPA: ABC transporter permease, partial [Burkholderiaceae bacterium]|nr:ABC transporter permease [Burkholderiaceae bacterium]
AVMWIEALKNAQRIHNKVGKTVTGAEFRDGYEALDITDAKLKELGILGMSAPFKMSCAKHDGSERFRMMQWDGKQFQMLTDWVAAPDPKFIRGLIEESAAKYAKENNITPRKCGA